MEHKCVGRAWSPGAFRSHQCGKTAKYEHDGRWYCKTHHPPTVAAKFQARHAELERERNEQAEAQKQAAAERAEMKRRAALFPELLEALKLIDELAFNGLDHAHPRNSATLSAICNAARTAASTT